MGGLAELALEPVLLGEGVPLLPPRYRPTRLRLVGSKVYKTGTVGLEYAVEGDGLKQKVDARRKDLDCQ